MKNAAEPDIPGGLSVFEKSCGYCGARFRVLAAYLPQGTASQDYACPECGKGYRLPASTVPEVQLLRPRSDGRFSQYQDTMF